ncbi:YcaO-like family protein [Pseudoalteromonas holothuriae]|uniref:YcaO-like family protein n=1 Tax=Pseudoalteromonas holothuriae TaxID=2963714 RepID=UPI0021BEF344|nr:YcaO-like family protein [Pseudoalteromonas sp. CIP111951]
MHIKNKHIASSIFNLKHSHVKESEFIFELSRLIGPQKAVRSVGQLKSTRIIITEETCANPPPIYDNIHRSYNYFEKIIIFGLQELNISFKNEETLYLNIENFSICNQCIIDRLFSHRPCLAMSLGRVKCYKLALSNNFYEPRKPQINAASNCLLVKKIQTKQVEKHILYPVGGCNCFQVPQRSSFKSAFLTEMKNKTKGFRTVNLNETHRNLINFVSEYVGIIHKLEEYRKSDCDLIFNYNSGKNPLFSKSINDEALTTFRSSSGGKGKSDLQSKVGALAEAIERYSMRFHNQQKPIYASYNELKHKALSPRLCLGFSETQYKETNSKDLPRYRAVPKPITNSEILPWFEVYGINTKKNKYVLADIAFSDFNYGSTAHAFADSNGCAAGNTYTEAVLQGTLELIERDAVAIWWYNKIKRSYIDIPSLNNDYINRINEYYTSINRSLKIIHITTDIGIPTFAAVSYKKDTLKGIVYGFGCHIKPSVAIERAVLEINQLLPLTLDNSPVNDNEFFEWITQQTITEHDFLEPKTNSITIDKLIDKSENCLESSISFICKTLTSNNIELYALDITTKDTQMPCVKMIAPGLCHFWRRTGQRRLYDVPVKMGWLKQEYKESELNQNNITI